MPVGCLTVVLEDAWSPHASTLLKYFVAEGIACQQQVLSITGNSRQDRLEDWLPRKVDKAPAPKPEEADADTGAAQQELRIAWQYRRYIKQRPAEPQPHRAVSSFRRAASSTAAPAQPRLAAWAHNYDLTKPCSREVLEQTAQTTEQIACAGVRDVGGMCGAVRAFVQRIGAAAEGAGGGVAAAGPSAALPTFSPKSVGRLAVHSLGGTHWQDCGTPAAEQAILATLLSIKALVRESRCAAMVTVPACMYSPSLQNKMQLIADVALSVQAVADDSEIVRLSTDPQSCCALLRIVKFTVPGMLTLPVTDPMLSLVRHRRTRLAIVPIEIDPDAEMVLAEAESRLAGSAASMLCGARPETALDF